MTLSPHERNRLRGNYFAMNQEDFAVLRSNFFRGLLRTGVRILTAGNETPTKL